MNHFLLIDFWIRLNQDHIIISKRQLVGYIMILVLLHSQRIFSIQYLMHKVLARILQKYKRSVVDYS